MKKIFTTIIICITAIITQAHNGAIVGKIIDATTNKPIENVYVEIAENNFATQSNIAGWFNIKDITVGRYAIQFTALGYTTYTTNAVVKDFETTTINITLKSKPITLQDVVVKSNYNLNLNAQNVVNLQRMPINNGQDMLRTVPGLFIAQHAGGGKAEQIFLRGFDCDHGTDIALSIDGMPINMVSHAHGQGYADMHFIIPETVEKINVQKGSYTATQGDFATGGSIQFVTKKYLKQNSVTIEKGMYNNNRALVQLNLLPNNIAKHNWYTVAEYNFNKGFFTSPMHLNRSNIFSKYNYSINTKNTLTLNASYFTSHWNASGQIPLRAVVNKSISAFGSIDSTEGGKTGRTNFTAILKTVLNSNNVITNQLYYNKYRFLLYSNFTFYTNDSVNGDMIMQKENRNIIGYNGTYENTTNLHKTNIATKIGVQIRYDDIQNIALSNVVQRYTFIKHIALGNIHQLNGAVFIDHKITFSKQWSINAGVRYDVFSFYYNNKLAPSNTSVVKGIASPKVSLYYNPNNTMQLYANIGRGFHSNDSRVVAPQNGLQTLPSALGSDLGLMYKPLKNLIINTALWQLNLQQEFVYVGDESVVEPNGATSRLGVDISARYQFLKHFTADMDFNYAYARLKDAPIEENRIPLAPIITSIGGISYNNNTFSATVRYRHLGNRPANELNTITAQGYTLIDAVTSYTYKQYKLSITAENILNTAWREAQFETETKLKNELLPTSEIHFTSGTPRNIRVGCSYTF